MELFYIWLWASSDRIYILKRNFIFNKLEFVSVSTKEILISYHLWYLSRQIFHIVSSTLFLWQQERNKSAILWELLDFQTFIYLWRNDELHQESRTCISILIYMNFTWLLFWNDWIHFYILDDLLKLHILHGLHDICDLEYLKDG